MTQSTKDALASLPHQLERALSKSVKTMQNSVKKWYKTKQIGDMQLSPKDWLHHTKSIKSWISQEKYTEDVEVDRGSEPLTAKTFPVMPSIQIPFLVEVHRLQNPNVIELGCSNGRMVWKTLLAGGNVFANDLYKNQIQQLKTSVNSKVPHKTANLKTDYGDVLSIMDRHPELEGSFDMVYSQNLIHYFVPDQFTKFSSIIYYLLKPGGKAYISGNHIYSLTSYLYKEFLKEFIEEEHVVRNFFRDTLIPQLEEIFEDLDGYYAVSSTENNQFQMPSNLQERSESMHIAFDSKNLMALLKSAGFLVKSYMCVDTSGNKSECYDDLSEIIQLNQNYGKLSDSQFVSVVLTKPLLGDKHHHSIQDDEF